MLTKKACCHAKRPAYTVVPFTIQPHIGLTEYISSKELNFQLQINPGCGSVRRNTEYRHEQQALPLPAIRRTHTIAYGTTNKLLFTSKRLSRV
jgi:hypothetical protein